MLNVNCFLNLKGVFISRKVVAIGGGHGLSEISKQLKRYPLDSYTTIVTPTDDGGLSGIYRTDYDVLSVGDYMLVVSSVSGLSDDAIRGLGYRFPNGRFNGNSSGHNIFASLCSAFGPEKAMEVIREIYRVPENIRILLPTLEKCTLCAGLEDGTEIREETNIDTRPYERGSQIKKVFLDPDRPQAYEPSKEAILNADMVILGPGSLYTSTLPSVLIPDVGCVLARTGGKKVYVCNVLTEPGSTHRYPVSEHIRALQRHGVTIDTVLVHTGGLTEDVVRKYESEGKYPVDYDRDVVLDLGLSVIEGDFAVQGMIPVRHSEATGKTLFGLLNK